MMYELEVCFLLMMIMIMSQQRSIDQLVNWCLKCWGKKKLNSDDTLLNGWSSNGSRTLGQSPERPSNSIFLKQQW